MEIGTLHSNAWLLAIDQTYGEYKKVAWLDSAQQPSHIHLTINGIVTKCGCKIEHKPEKKRSGRSNYCKVCFQNQKKSAYNWY
jgi:hypothetical protein